MKLENVTANALRAYRFFPHPTSSTVGILRLDTANEQAWFLVTRKVLLMLSDISKQHADELDTLS